MDFPGLVKAELERARRKHPEPQRNLHEAYGVLLEEVDEFWDEVKKQNNNRAATLAELVQVAAMCQRTAEDLNLHQDQDKRCSKCGVLMVDNVNKYCGFASDKNEHQWEIDWI